MPDLPDPVINMPPHTKEWPSTLVAGGCFGIFAYCLSLLSPFVAFGSSVLFFFLYTWPFFLALLPVAIFLGMAVSVWQPQKLLVTFILTLVIVSGSFWVLFYMFVGW
ncbi:DUF3561 domain-containing protein [Rosenbergiella australiborealis]|uniref:DUF3561 domain-containing protein n=1 Tax=Rosenbergiella australiborealis TaxID=1544696 RepID=A0ABS5T6J5_9GAMM|nr:DUF3561 family protein [Rosenbergiella australiborealis]MBT0727981.1 DUF3561 domain-containing protein [Rosenbergiella australiborealis]